MITQQTQQFKILSFLFLVYITFASNASLWDFFDGKVQLSELVFLLLLPFSIPLFKKLDFTNLDYLLMSYVGIFLLNFAIHQDRNVFIETAGIIYLFGLYFLLSRFLSRIFDFEDFLKKSILGFALLTSGAAILGFLLYVFNITADYIWVFENYPYLGDVLRWTGFSSSPNMLLSNLALSFFLLQVIDIPKQQKNALSIIVLICILLTLSKGILLMLGMIFFLLFRAYVPKWSIFPYSWLLAMAIVTLTFFVFKPTTELGLNYSNNKIVGKTAIVETEKVSVFPTCYYYMFKSSTILLKENPLFGVGSGSFLSSLHGMKTRNIYPTYIPSFEAHDMYWGQAAELGIGYIFFLIALAIGIYSFALNKEGIIPEQYHFYFLLAIIFILIESTVNGAKHFRHYWVFLAIINNFYLRCKAKPTTENRQP